MKNKYHILQKMNSAALKLSLIAAIGFFSASNSFAQTYATVPFNDGFETASLGPSWTETSTLATGGNTVIQTGTLTWSTQTAYSHTGNYFLGMHYPTGGSYNTNQVNLYLNLSGESNIRLSFWWAEWNDESEAQDGVFVSDDNGLTFTKVLDLPGAAYTDLVYTHFDMSIDSINAVHGLTMSSQYIVRFQQYDNYYFAGGNDGHLYDDVSVYPVCGSSSSISESACTSYTTPSGDETYTASGIYMDTIPNAVGCDSLITIDLTINASSASIAEQSCGAYTAPDGMTYSTTGIYTAIIPNSQGCDSTITIDLQVNQPSSNSITESVCDTYTAPDGMTYTASGNYTAIIPNGVGCDSTITIDLTVNTASTTNITENICSGSSYTAPDGMIYDSTGTYTALIQSSAGCDSTIVIDLSVNTATSSTVSETALDSYTVPSGDETYTQSGTYMDTILNSNGCDSIITINLTVEYTDLEELNTSNISVYPNPTSGMVHLEGIDELTGVASIQIFDSRGRLVATLDEVTETLNLHGVESGTYLVMIHHENGTERIPVVKK
ncbi:MAG: T9SS type A sorting domain-containing protein [Crocinitomicaceae bacterium]|nr:T9SS type A sorting domain-containing protein [Crocinitomicaceae bacterium]